MINVEPFDPSVYLNYVGEDVDEMSRPEVREMLARHPSGTFYLDGIALCSGGVVIKKTTDIIGCPWFIGTVHFKDNWRELVKVLKNYMIYIKEDCHIDYYKTNNRCGQLGERFLKFFDFYCIDKENSIYKAN